MTTTDQDPVRGFLCADCRARVYSLAPPHNPSGRCGVCQFIANMDDPVEREQLRAYMARDRTAGATAAPR